jgi:hypothetical protein
MLVIKYINIVITIANKFKEDRHIIQDKQTSSMIQPTDHKILFSS